MVDDDERTHYLLSVVRASLAIEKAGACQTLQNETDPWAGQDLAQALRQTGPQGPSALRARWKQSWEQRGGGNVARRREESDPWNGLSLAQALRPSLQDRKPDDSLPKGPSLTATKNPRQQVEDSFGGLSLSDVFRRSAPRRALPAPSPVRDVITARIATSNVSPNDDWHGQSLAEVLVPSRRREARTDPAAYEPRRRRDSHDSLRDWGGGLGDVLVRHSRSNRHPPAFEPTRRQRPRRQSALGGDRLTDAIAYRQRPDDRLDAEHRRLSTFEPARTDYLRDDELTYERLLALDAAEAQPNDKLIAHRRKVIANVLSTVIYDAAANASDGHDRSCVVCLDAFNDAESLKQLPCRHLFHRRCIAKWLEHDMRCPTCRRDILSE